MDFTESKAKKVARKIIYNNVTTLRPDKTFSYFGLPGRACLDIDAWRQNISFACGCELDKDRFKEMQRTMHRLIPGRAEAYNGSIWKRMQDENKKFIDLCNLDFCGGPTNASIPEIEEVNSLRAFFINQRKKEDREFYLAWTLGVRNENFKYYADKIGEYLKEAFPLTKIDVSAVVKWYGDSKHRMVRCYTYFIPCMTFECAKQARYRVEVIETFVYKKIMYFGLFKVIPSPTSITKDQIESFFNTIFKGRYVIYDEDGNYVDVLNVSLEKFFKK